MKAELVIALLAVAMLCFTALAQENTTDYWMKKATEFRYKGLFDESVQAYDKALQIDPGNASIWVKKALDLGIISRLRYIPSPCNDSKRSTQKYLAFRAGLPRRPLRHE